MIDLISQIFARNFLISSKQQKYCRKCLRIFFNIVIIPKIPEYEVKINFHSLIILKLVRAVYFLSSRIETDLVSSIQETYFIYNLLRIENFNCVAIVLFYRIKINAEHLFLPDNTKFHLYAIFIFFSLIFFCLRLQVKYCVRLFWLVLPRNQQCENPLIQA